MLTRSPLPQAGEGLGVRVTVCNPDHLINAKLLAALEMNIGGVMARLLSLIVSAIMLFVSAPAHVGQYDAIFGQIQQMVAQ